LKRKRIGLVLTGGGAKGAYQVGCWKALRQAGITQFKAIAGTSVGAMNAVLIAGDDPGPAEAAWSGIHWNDVITINPLRLFLVPAWGLAYLLSEFSPLRLISFNTRATRSLRTMCVRAVATLVGLWSIDHTWRGGSLAAAMSTVAVGKSMVHKVTRRIMLTYIGVSTAPLSKRLSQIIADDQVARMRRSRTRLYGVLSCLRNRKNVHPEWVPRYVRLDRMKREDLIETLVAGAGFPGLSDTRGLDETIVDGGWTDNIPIAPFLFDPQNTVDVLIVINTGNESVGLSKETATPDSLKQWAISRWRKLHPHARGVDPQLPEIIWVMPSVSIGGFYSGTCGFTQKKATAMMAQGEKDMAAALKNYSS